VVRLVLSFFACLALLGCGRSDLVDYSGLEDASVALPLPPRSEDGGVPCTTQNIDDYELPPFERRAIDVLFVIDDSCSMANDQRRLGENLNSFFSAFTAAQVDFHVGVITTDMSDPARSGKLVAPFLTQNTPNVANEFESSVLVGTNGSGDERGLQALRTALRPPLTDMENAGFIRTEADFAAVILADEDDHAPLRVDFVTDAVRALKPDQQAITVGAILLSCGFSVGNWRYAQFARAFGERGITTTCTQDYASTLRTIAGRAINKSCVVGLKRRLDPSRQITATLNGAATGIIVSPPEDAFPNGTVEAVPCPEAGGTLRLTWSLCD
jgi:hypothetical protein